MAVGIGFPLPAATTETTATDEEGRVVAHALQTYRIA